MIRGTTPTYTFEIPLDPTLIKDFRVSFAQDGLEVVKKAMGDEGVELTGQTITVRLTEQDTFDFEHEKNTVQIQIRVLTTGGDIMTSNIMNVNIWQSLNGDELTPKEENV